MIKEKTGTLAAAAPILALIAIVLAVAVMLLVTLMLWRSRGAKNT